MTCQELVRWLADYLDDEIPDAARRHFEQHLAACEDCQKFLNTYRETIRLCADAGETEESLEEEMPEDLLRAILAARSNKERESS